MNDDVDKSLKRIEKLYNNLSYYDLYSGSILILFSLLLILFCCVSYFSVLKNMTKIKENWATERCKPSNIPFVGLINKPDNMTMEEFTIQNFEYCMQDILKNVTGYAIMPITYVTSSMLNVFADMIKAIQDIRVMITNIRTSLTTIVEDVMGRLMNFIIPIQQLVIVFTDLMGKIKGIFATSIYTVMSVYYTLQSAINVVINGVTVILIVLAALIIILWIVPFTWGAALAGTLTFVSIAIPLALLLSFMVKVFHLNPSVTIPGVPSMCFDGDASVLLQNKSVCAFKDLQLGDILPNGSGVVASMKLENVHSTMCRIGDILVTPEHLVYDEQLGDWVCAEEHPNKTVVEYSGREYLYCVNTSKKEIMIGGLRFLDWDEIIIDGDEDDLEYLYEELGGGFFRDTQKVFEIRG